MIIKKVYCPVNGWDCPYWKKDGSCTLENPMNECDDFSFFWDEDEEYFIEEECGEEYSMHSLPRVDWRK